MRACDTALSSSIIYVTAIRSHRRYQSAGDLPSMHSASASPEYPADAAIAQGLNIKKLLHNQHRCAHTKFRVTF